MHKNNGLVLEHYINGVIRVAMYTILPLIGLVAWVIGVPIVLYGGVMSSLDYAENAFQVLFIFSLPMLLFLTVLPVLFEKKRMVSWKDLGLAFEKSKKNVIMLAINLMVVAYAMYRMLVCGGELEKTIPIILQLIVIGISEETICRGVIYHEIKSCIGKEIWSVIISSLLFSFVFHSGDTDSANLFIRLPLGLVLGTVRYYTGNIYNSVAMHIWYNALLITM